MRIVAFNYQKNPNVTIIFFLLNFFKEEKGETKGLMEEEEDHHHHQTRTPQGMQAMAKIE